MIKKDFTNVARAVNVVWQQNQDPDCFDASNTRDVLEVIANQLAHRFEQEYPKFDTGEFMSACFLTP